MATTRELAEIVTLPVVLLFNTCADPARAARFHTPTCPMVNTAKSGRVTRSDIETRESLIEVVEDLDERLWFPKFCKCCK